MTKRIQDSQYTQQPLTGTAGQRDHRHDRDRYQAPDQMTGVATFGNSSIATFDHSANVSSGTAPDAAAYVSTVAQCLDGYLNSDDWREDAEEQISCEFRPAHTEPTSQQVLISEDRDIEFDPRTSIFDRSKLTKGAAKAGDVAFTLPCETAALFSSRITILDANVIGGWTSNAAEQTCIKFLQDFRIKCNTVVAKVLAKRANLRKIKAPMPEGKPREVAEDLIDILALNMDTAFGHNLSDFDVLLPLKLSAILDRAAQRAGLEDAEELIGCGLSYHTGPDVMFVMPKGFAALSFREDGNGEVWKLDVTRNPNLQGYDVEVQGIADVLANAMVRLKVETIASNGQSEGFQTETVPLPIISMIDLRKDGPSVPKA